MFYKSKLSPDVLVGLTLFLVLISNQANSLTTESTKGSLLSELNSNSFLMASQLQPNIPKEIEHFLTITGTASRTVQTDLVLIGLNVQTLDLELSTSYRENTLASNKLAKIFKDLKIPERNITTTSYDTIKKHRNVWVPYNSTWGDIFEGYQVSNKLEVMLSDIKIASDLIDRALAVGPVLVTSISFDYSKIMQKKLKDKLLPIAAKDAITRAKISAQALRVTIDDVESASVSEFQPFPVYARQEQYRIAQDNGIAAASFAPEIFAGKTKVETNIFVKFIISKD